MTSLDSSHDSATVYYLVNSLCGLVLDIEASRPSSAPPASPLSPSNAEIQSPPAAQAPATKKNKAAAAALSVGKLLSKGVKTVKSGPSKLLALSTSLFTHTVTFTASPRAPDRSNQRWCVGADGVLRSKLSACMCSVCVYLSSLCLFVYLCLLLCVCVSCNRGARMAGQVQASVH